MSEEDTSLPEDGNNPTEDVHPVLKELSEELAASLESLQRAIAFADDPTPPGTISLKIVRTSPLTVRMEPDKNHGCPHVHIDCGCKRRAASYRIEPPGRLVGKLDTDHERLVLGWIQRHKPQLLRGWAILKAGGTVTSWNVGALA